MNTDKRLAARTDSAVRPGYPWYAYSGRIASILFVGALALSPAAGAEEPEGAAVPASLNRALAEEVLGGDEARTLEATEGDRVTSSKDQRKVWSKVDRSEGSYVFGSTVLLPADKEDYPEGWLFVGKQTGGEWKVQLEGTQEFAALTDEAPKALIDNDEKELFSEEAGTTTDDTYREAAARYRTGLRLPWARGTSWKLTGGPHGWSTGYDRPYSSLDLTGRSGSKQKVRSAGRGKVYRMCPSNRGWLRVVHPNGYTTDYYHLRHNIKPRQGKWVRAGGYLGRTGTNVSCGGSATGRHVHFALRRSGNYVKLDDKVLGGWKFEQGVAYRGKATHNGRSRRPVTSLRNYGN